MQNNVEQQPLFRKQSNPFGWHSIDQSALPGQRIKTMRIPTATPFAHATQKLVSWLRSWTQRQRVTTLTHRLNQQFQVLPFNADNEHLFWQVRQTEILNTLKIALLLGMIYFLAFNTLAVFNGGFSISKIIAYLLIVPTLGILCLNLQRHPNPMKQINKVAKLSATLSAANLICILLIENNPVFYSQIWAGLVPVYFFTYGQMFMSISETAKFGLLTMIALPLSGYLIGIETMALMPSIIILLIVNTFGFGTRCQLERNARNLFLERRKAEQTSQEKTLFLRQFSHNLRQPLQALNCYASVLDAALTDKQSEQGKQLQMIAGKLGLTIDNLNHTFNRILDIANLDTGQQIPQLTTVDINRLLTELENRFSEQATNKGLKLNIRLRLRPPYTVYSDPDILSQILGNLIDNAIKYTISGWILITAVKTNGDRLKLHVRDSGIGIAAEFHATFKEFSRCQTRQANVEAHGLGIGLAYALKATECLPNHRLQVNSRLNKGSDFQLCLPVISPAQPL